MPGIAGIISLLPKERCEPLVEEMISSMLHDPFYVSGTHSAPEVGLYAGWVAHENSLAAGQVFFNERQDIALLFSGECFPTPELRSELRSKGHEVGAEPADWLVHLYEERGEKFFGELNGLFSGLLVDERQNRIFLFNDRYGFNRLYIHETPDALYFATEAKGLLGILPELRAFSTEGVSDFLAFGCPLNGRTLFRGINLLPGGSLWTFDAANACKRRYFTPGEWEAQPTLTVAEFQERFEATFKRVLPRYFASESKLGISLTAGLDTRMIMACGPKSTHKPVCYTYAGQNGEILDSRIAAEIAAACGLEHTTIRLEPDFFTDFSSCADRTVYVTDGCFGITGAHEIYLSAKARQLAPVRLTGVFGGEVLRAVSTFKPLGLSPDLFNPELRPFIESSRQEFAGLDQHPVTFAAFREGPWSVFGSLAACGSQLSFRTPYLDNELVGLAYRAPDDLRNSSLSALQVVKRNAPNLRSIPTDMGIGSQSGVGSALKRLSARATFKLDYLANDGLPHWLSRFDPFFDYLSAKSVLFGHHKYLRYRSWFRRELASYLNDSFADWELQQSPFWNRDFVRGLAERHIRGQRNHLGEINAVLTLNAVERLLVRSPNTGSNRNERAGRKSALV